MIFCWVFARIYGLHAKAGSFLPLRSIFVCVCWGGEGGNAKEGQTKVNVKYLLQFLLQVNIPASQRLVLWPRSILPPENWCSFIFWYHIQAAPELSYRLEEGGSVTVGDGWKGSELMVPVASALHIFQCLERQRKAGSHGAHVWERSYPLESQVIDMAEQGPLMVTTMVHGPGRGWLLSGAVLEK